MSSSRVRANAERLQAHSRPKPTHTGWARKLISPLTIPGGPTLVILADVRAYMLGLPKDEGSLRPWQHAAGLALAAAEGHGDLKALEDQIVLASFLRGRVIQK